MQEAERERLAGDREINTEEAAETGVTPEASVRGGSSEPTTDRSRSTDRRRPRPQWAWTSCSSAIGGDDARGAAHGEARRREPNVPKTAATIAAMPHEREAMRSSRIGSAVHISNA